MGIDFKRRLRFLMPCKILNGLYIDAPQKQVGDVGMSQNVWRYIEVEAVGVSATLCLCSQFGFHLERRLFPIGITVVYPLFSSPPFDISPHTPKLCFGQGISVRCMDYKVRGTVRLLSLQASGELVGNWNRPSGRFGLQAIRNHRLAVLESGSSPHINMRRFVQMHAVPLQTKDLFGAKAGVQPDHAEQVRRTVLDGVHNLAYDMDALENANVREAKERIISMGIDAGFDMIPLSWNATYKGVDDLFVSMLQNKLKA